MADVLNVLTGVDNGVPGSPLSAAQLQQWALQYKTDITHLENKVPPIQCSAAEMCHIIFNHQNTNLQRDLEEAVAQVGQLQVLTMELEGRLEEDGRIHQEAVASRDDEIDALNQRVTEEGIIDYVITSRNMYILFFS